MSRALVGIMVITLAAGALGGCRRGAPTPRGSFRPFPPLGQRIMVLAPHPDDEVLGAAGLIDTARHAGADVRVIVATDGAAGSAKTVARADLARERESETRRAVAELGLPPESISFLRASDGRLGALWDRGWGRAGDREASSADAIVEALRAAFATTAPDTVVLPMPLDEHPDHRALHHFALLAMLTASPETHPPEVLGYLIHGSRRWATASFDPAATEPPAEGCAGALFPWTQLVLDPAGVVRKAALIEVYRTQVGRSRRLLRHARRAEPFARGEIIVGRRSDVPHAPWRHTDARRHRDPPTPGRLRYRSARRRPGAVPVFACWRPRRAARAPARRHGGDDGRKSGTANAGRDRRPGRGGREKRPSPPRGRPVLHRPGNLRRGAASR